MTFEEFFIKKRIDLPALEKAEPSLFSEFKAHFQQMGEKSFDHTKKYWFNKLRRKYHLAPEIKPEKLHIPNPLAEQTITESLSETIVLKAEPKLGFVPKFKSAAVAKPAVEEEREEVSPAVSEETPTEKQRDVSPAKPAYKPRFNMKNIPPKAGE